MRFEKWQGLGNNYLILERDLWPIAITSAVAKRLCDRAFGVGGDGVLEIANEGSAPRMIVWNPDGSQAENCGNGIRMVARYLAASDRLPADGTVLTGAGPVRVTLPEDGTVRVAMGRATFPAGADRTTLVVDGQEIEFLEVSMGNPHAIIEHENPSQVVGELGPHVEVDARFPERTNVEFVRVDGPDALTMSVWERGVGETLACGTGACAAAVAAVGLGGLTSPVTVHLAGGDLAIDVDDDLEVTMTGPAEAVYAGRLSRTLADALEEL